MQTRSRDIFATIRTEGALLPADLLQRIAEGDGDLEGLKPNDYHLVGGQKVREAISSSWNKLLGVWNSFRAAVDKLPEKELGTTLTREKWLLPLFQELGYGRLLTSKAVVIEGKSYPISHFWQPAPIHLIGCRVDIDSRTAGVAGAARISPHSLVQEFLNRSDEHLWAFVSNGLRLRILRDNVSLTRQAFVEFDLAGMMDGEVYSDFILLWLLCHQSRVEVPEDKSPEHCWLEKWSQAAQQRGTRALDQLRNGVEEAIKSLGSGFLSHLANTELKEKLKKGTLDKQDYYRQLLRIVYRLIFIFVSEDRGLLLNPQADQQAKDFYMQHYSATRLRKLAQNKRGTQHYDLWRGLSLVFDKLGSNEGCPELALPALGSYLWSREAIADLDGCDIANRDLLEAVRALAFTVDNNILRAVDYKNLGSEELGSVYESLLELHPELNVVVGTFELSQVAGSERKTTGSYYTPSSLVNCLLDSALEPVLDDVVKKSDPEQAILNLKICDPATGSGHFLVSAAHRIAKRLAAVRTGDEEPSPEALRHALRDVISHCIYGVDINPMSVELCKISLWLEAIEPGKPLSFLDHHIKCGNSLLGTTPALMAKGIPDEAFNPIEGDVKAVCNEFKKQNHEERKKGQRFMLFEDGKKHARDRLSDLTQLAANLDDLVDDDIASLEQKRQRYEQLIKSSDYEYGHLLADLWCAAFVIKKDNDLDYAITENIYRDVEKNPHNIAPWPKTEVKRLANEYRVFHWHLEFPSVFHVPDEGEKPDNEHTGLCGGFDCVLGNPPWEKVKLQEKEYFATRSPEVAMASKPALRKQLIKNLKQSNSHLYHDYLNEKRIAEGVSLLLRYSGVFPLCGRGDVNTFSVFAELKRNILGQYGRVGCIVPSGIATDDTTKFFFQDLMNKASLVSLYDFENREKLFPAVHRSMKFCLLTLTGSQRPAQLGADFVYFATNTSHLAENTRHFSLTSEEIDLLNPKSHTCPIFRSKHDAELAKHIYENIPVLCTDRRGEANKPWRVRITTMFHMTNDAPLFRDQETLLGDCAEKKDLYQYETNDSLWLPIFEGKMIDMYDHRKASIIINPNNPGRPQQKLEHGVNEHTDAYFTAKPFLWAPRNEVDAKISRLWSRNWLIGIKRITASTNQRTFIGCVLPYSAVSYTILLSLTDSIHTDFAPCLLANYNAFVADFCIRQKTAQAALPVGCVLECPIVTPNVYEDALLLSRSTSLKEWITSRVMELSYTSFDLESFAVDFGYDDPPFVWDEERRFKIRSELDAAYFHLYLGTEQEWKEKSSKELLKYFPAPRDAVDYIMETFPIVKRKDEAKHGSYRTKELILEIYDKMTEAIQTGRPYDTILDPLPADPSIAHPPRDSSKPTVIEKINPVYTIGHSNTSIDKLVSLLKQNKIQVLADVRSVPYSRHVPQANREAIERAVKAASIKYLFIGEQLGGRPKDIKIKDEQGNLDYSKLALTERFREGMDRLLKGASQYYVCLMCSEEDPSRCHRSLLISRELDKLGVEVRHIRRDGHIETQGELEKQIPPAQEGLFSEK